MIFARQNYHKSLYPNYKQNYYFWRLLNATEFLRLCQIIVLNVTLWIVHSTAYFLEQCTKLSSKRYGRDKLLVSIEIMLLFWLEVVSYKRTSVSSSQRSTWVRYDIWFLDNIRLSHLQILSDKFLINISILSNRVFQMIFLCYAALDYLGTTVIPLENST